MILVMGGTTESLEIADVLEGIKVEFILSVVSDYGKVLANQHHGRVIARAMDEAALEEYIKVEHINLVIDATHPFAKVASQNAIEATGRLNIKYIRFERPNNYESDQNIRLFNTVEDACNGLRKTEGTIYLTTGSKTVEDYVNALGIERIHARVLPVPSVVSKLTDVGLRADQIDGMRGPFSEQLNVQMLKHADASALVTKESGLQGGINEKIAACQELNIPCFIIKRPQLDYPHMVSSVSELMKELG
ncbi:precorrin-6A reductase [Pediococcus claussenii]|uniref:Precorrin-6x reductase n=1 Tax=Pediococcus claussenii (strain ATCC BAA-344 / DSM 14800 / JCM 18046 / KCTC 3811 / LMG 21948 / P06) TaxID=701521 RepID=G8PEK9_PEDCP|nr:precorrin-6A reductase [Pediococcus claussenii]AEV95618.1 precorrin-6x reductase [Pediococcus claussenii ATCC BAA-344]ANZ69138.1 precorrin-6x reductase [Pediococcus claussenii]ANZ70955.1 precorrin-6x reductase [Pediococcus claussenii]KRN20149.1 cbiJ protein [Pediococcus claussenii]